MGNLVQLRSELKAMFSSCISKGLNTSVVGVTTSVKGHFCYTFLQATFGNHFTYLLCHFLSSNYAKLRRMIEKIEPWSDWWFLNKKVGKSISCRIIKNFKHYWKGQRVKGDKNHGLAKWLNSHLWQGKINFSLPLSVGNL